MKKKKELRKNKLFLQYNIMYNYPTYHFNKLLVFLYFIKTYDNFFSAMYLSQESCLNETHLV